MAVDSFFSFLNFRKQHTNLKLKLIFKIETETTLTEQNRSTKTFHDRPIQVATTGYTSQPQIQNSAKLPTKPISKLSHSGILEY